MSELKLRPPKRPKQDAGLPGTNHRDAKIAEEVGATFDFLSLRLGFAGGGAAGEEDVIERDEAGAEGREH
jgi:hypothetical protein